MVFDHETIDASADTLYVDCTASAVAGNVNDLTPVFEPGTINLQMVRQFQPCFSSALIAFIEAHVHDEAERQNMTRPTPMTDTLEDYLRGLVDGLLNQASWNGNEQVAGWISQCRLDGFGGLIKQVSAADTEKMATLGRIMEAAPRAAGNLQRLVTTPS